MNPNSHEEKRTCHYCLKAMGNSWNKFRNEYYHMKCMNEIKIKESQTPQTEQQLKAESKSLGKFLPSGTELKLDDKGLIELKKIKDELYALTQGSGSVKPDDSFCKCGSATYYERGIMCEDCGKIGLTEAQKKWRLNKKEEKPKLEECPSFIYIAGARCHVEAYTKESVEKSLNYIKDECSAIFEKMPLSTKQEEYWGERMIELIEYVEERLK